MTTDYYERHNIPKPWTGDNVPLCSSRGPRYVEAYLAMATRADYRPSAPGDGMGHVTLTKEQSKDDARLAQEARAYAERFNAEENTRAFFIGCSNFDTNKALIWTIEAARALCGGNDGLAIVTVLG